MPRFLVERLFTDVDEEDMPEIGASSRRLLETEFPEVTWEHSHVVMDPDGASRTFCVYDAPDEETVRRHAERLGRHKLERLYQIDGDVTPADFPI